MSRTEHADRQTLEAMLGERRAGLVRRAKRTAGIDLLPPARETGLEALVGGWWRDLALSSGAREHALDWAILLATEGEAAGDELLLGDLRAVLHDAYESVYGIGYFGLSKLTGVPYDETHDGPWWRAWWQKNRQRFASEVAALDIPSVAPVAR